MSQYQDFVRKARERFDARRKSVGGVIFTRHAQYKMREYNLSEQRVRRVMRTPRRTEEGIAEKTIAVMQPVSTKRGKDGKETWGQEIWVMYRLRKDEGVPRPSISRSALVQNGAPQLRVISVWRYPGVSPKRNPIPEAILREIEEGSILEEE